MKTLKILALVTITAMTCSQSVIADSYNCDGTALQNCHPSHTMDPVKWTGPGPSCNNADVEESVGSANILACTSSYEDQGICTQNGTVPCTYTVTVTDNDTGTVIYTGTVGWNCPTYTC